MPKKKTGFIFPPESIPVIDACLAIAGKGTPVQGIPNGIAVIGPKGLVALSPTYDSFLVIGPEALTGFGVVAPQTREIIPLETVATLFGLNPGQSIGLTWKGSVIRIRSGKVVKKVDDVDPPPIWKRGAGELLASDIPADVLDTMITGSSLAGADSRIWGGVTAVQISGQMVSAASGSGARVRRAGPLLIGGTVISLGSRGLRAGCTAARHLFGEVITIRLTDKDLVIGDPADMGVWIRRSVASIPDGVVTELSPCGPVDQIPVKEFLTGLKRLKSVDGSVAWIDNRLVAARSHMACSVPAPCPVINSSQFSVTDLCTVLTDWIRSGVESIGMTTGSTRGKVHVIRFDAGAVGAFAVHASGPTPEQMLADS
jgi:hypothetical protein